MNATRETLRKWTLDLGKVDANGRGRKANRVTLDVELRLKQSCAPHLDIDLNPCPEYTELSICGNVWNAAGSDISSGGQCYDTITTLFPSNAKVQRLVELWKRWHLNGMKAGTREQENFLKDADIKAVYPKSHYDLACAVLEKANLLTVTGGPEVLNANGAMVRRNYRYGSAWLCEPLPSEVEAEIVALCGELTAQRTANAPECDPKNFAQEHGIHADVEHVDSNPNMEDARDGAHHYKVTLRRGKARLTVPFTMGAAHTKPPTAIEVLGCLASDAQTMVNCQDFEEWAGELGFDKDSRKSEKTYNACLRQTEKLKKFLGEELFQSLLKDSNG
jgi:hypothetical protein